AHVLCRVCMFRRGARYLASRLVRVGPASEIVAVIERRDRALERKDLQSVRRQVEVADDLGPEQAHDVREHGELEAGNDFLGDGGTADERATLEHDDLATRARE